ncbi:serine/threonine-protein kinase [Sandaracinus amylolyticus]|uniref:serine/threonine-protein kinase n=1 Tax=Sandaracinus amylolyticus TaxID=927083 RepID=UPI001F375CE5|nr:serine/threonine-protein kinase [Sandaracinus amylolyticus]
MRIERLVSRSAAASVYRGERAGDAVAVKVYAPHLAEKARSVERAGREREAQRAIDHPFVARLLDAGHTDDGAPYLVSEWIQGHTLEQRLGAGAMTWAELRPIAAAIARALGAIHRASIVHRDVKPSNIVLPEAGEPAAMLLDFGHALLLDEVRLTESGFSLGTAAYMAPEHAEGAAIDGRADLYSLGVVLYRALAGVLPFDDVSPALVIDRHRYDPVVPPRVRAPERAVDPMANDLVMWLLEKDPAQRVPNATVLLHTIR